MLGAVVGVLLLCRAMPRGMHRRAMLKRASGDSSSLIGAAGTEHPPAQCPLAGQQVQLHAHVVDLMLLLGQLVGHLKHCRWSWLSRNGKDPDSPAAGHSLEDQGAPVHMAAGPCCVQSL